ncbi:hypothetical protein GCM10023311_09990 [Flaviramulus aquimarinus]|uniref:HTH araC/xylS-type domain-containing protein n=2 Tax=Flaviramulus aquimarinus TaxID=1170456 RepID=A0ABP9EWL1_9FLAO
MYMNFQSLVVLDAFLLIEIIAIISSVLMILVAYFTSRKLLKDSRQTSLLPSSSYFKRNHSYSNSFSFKKKKKLFQKLTTYVEDQQVFLNSNICLKELSDALGTNSKYLSLAINSVSKKTFIDFINHYRIEHAKHQLINIYDLNYTIEAIAKGSGFKSMSAFYNAFKKNCGMTPSNYLKKHLKT